MVYFSRPSSFPLDSILSLGLFRLPGLYVYPPVPCRVGAFWNKTCHIIYVEVDDNFSGTLRKYLSNSFLNTWHDILHWMFAPQPPDVWTWCAAPLVSRPCRSRGGETSRHSPGRKDKESWQGPCHLLHSWLLFFQTITFYMTDHLWLKLDIISFFVSTSRVGTCASTSLAKP